MQIYSIYIQGEQILKFPSINAKGRMNFHFHVNKQKNPQNIFPLTKMSQRRTLIHFPSCSIWNNRVKRVKQDNMKIIYRKALT